MSVTLFNLCISACGGGGGSSEPTVKIADLDSDNINNSEDAFPLDPNESKDTDGVGDNSNPDIDGDGANHEDDMEPFDLNSIAALQNLTQLQMLFINKNKISDITTISGVQ